MIKIIQKGNKTLQETAKTVPIEDITSDHIKKVLADMKEALDSQEDGVALAAPQINIPLQIFIVSERAFSLGDENEKTDKDIKELEHLIFVNPKIIKLSKKKAWMEEGCLSVRWLYGLTKRSLNATVEAYDEHGRKFTRGAGGLLAQIFQHETDHLNGILFTDHAKEIEEVLPKSDNKSNEK